MYKAEWKETLHIWEKKKVALAFHYSKKNERRT